MCGLFCFFGGSETTPREAIDTQKVFQALEKRGPDGTGLFETDGLLFAHSRLSIIDVQERSNQPFIGERWVLAYNGEIVNYRSLRQDLSKEGAVFAPNRIQKCCIVPLISGVRKKRYLVYAACSLSPHSTASNVHSG